jgi:hypothetical protein
LGLLRKLHCAIENAIVLKTQPQRSTVSLRVFSIFFPARLGQAVTGHPRRIDVLNWHVSQSGTELQVSIQIEVHAKHE